MRKRKSRKAVTLAGADLTLWATTETESEKRASKIDRRTRDFLFNAELAPAYVDNPDGPDKIIVMRTLRGDPLGRMRARKYIDEAQYNAGRQWQAHYEMAEINGAQAIDTTRAAVDGGVIPEPFTDAQREAIRELGRAARAVGLLGEVILKDVLANRMYLEQSAAARGMRVADVSYRFKQALDTIAIVYGFAMRCPQYPQRVVCRA